LKLHYFTSKGAVRALDGLTFNLHKGETLGLVGESGCGKTTTGVALLNMPSPPGRIVGGKCIVDGIDVVGLPDKKLRREVRWTRIAMVFQGAMNCLTPVYTIRELMQETYREHRDGWDKADCEARMTKYVALVGLPSHVLDRYPHELSGGMKQRIVIAMALFLEPHVVIMDEPTTALDVIVQAQILNLIKDLKKKLGLAAIFITHDLATEAEVADRILVMYAGKAVEVGTNDQVFGPVGPSHPYSQKLLAATPRLHQKVDHLDFIAGSPPDLIAPPPGCRFAPRCPFAKDKCRQVEPVMTEIEPRHAVACWKAIKDTEYERS
ncbi:MAG TPA: ABC transporter ATP-binding protein, partial [Spirochaetia bacterium]|nr:ABC transporter ATP-binding protein [Spirochaetia bacterium]